MTENTTHKRCIACDEEIRTRASVCRYCSAAQSPTKWGAIKSVAKWTASIVTIISLVLGVNRVNGLYKQWLERQTATSEMVEAARQMALSGEYRFAWNMYNEAAKLSPGSDDVKKGRTELAMSWLENARTIDSGTFSAIADPLIPVLYRGLVDLEGEAAATVLGHIAYAYYLKYRDVHVEIVDIDDLYDRALAFDPNNAYANTMYAHWLLFLGRDVDRALPMFEVALATDGTTREWVREMQLTALYNPLSARPGGSDDPHMAKIRLALVAAACDMHTNGEARPGAEMCQRILRCYGQAYRGEYVEEQLEARNPAEQLAMVRWLAEGTESESTLLDAQVSYVTARLTEATGEADLALAMYRELAGEDLFHHELALRVDASIERITGETSARLQESRERNRHR